MARIEIRFDTAARSTLLWIPDVHVVRSASEDEETPEEDGSADRNGAAKN